MNRDSIWSQRTGQGWEWGMGPLRSIDGPDARHTVLEAMSPEAGHVVIHYFHLAATEGWVLEQVQLVIWAILGGGITG